MQQVRVITYRAAAVATTFVCRTLHSGKITSLIIRDILHNNGGSPLLDNPAPCAVCYVGGRSTTLMVPARTQCPPGWTIEYAGYLVSEYMGSTDGHHRTSYICLDKAPEIASGGTGQNQAVIYPVQILCGSLPCSIYPTGRELACIVCSK